MTEKVCDDGEITWDDVAKEADELAEEWERHSNICAEAKYDQLLTNSIALYWRQVALHVRAAVQAGAEYDSIRKSRS